MEQASSRWTARRLRGAEASVVFRVPREISQVPPSLLSSTSQSCGLGALHAPAPAVFKVAGKLWSKTHQSILSSYLGSGLLGRKPFVDFKLLALKLDLVNGQGSLCK